MNAGCAGKTVRSLENACHTWPPISDSAPGPWCSYRLQTLPRSPWWPYIQILYTPLFDGNWKQESHVTTSELWVVHVQTEDHPQHPTWKATALDTSDLSHVLSVLWHCWLGHLTRKNPSPIWPILCWWDVKPYSINLSHSRKETRSSWSALLCSVTRCIYNSDALIALFRLPYDIDMILTKYRDVNIDI